MNATLNPFCRSLNVKKNEVQIGKVYLAKVSDKVVPVRIDAESPHGGWDGTNMSTNKKVRIKSPQRLRGLAAPGSGAKTTPGKHGKPKPHAAAAPADEPTPAEPTSPRKRGRTTRENSGLSAAAKVLADAGEPLTAGQIVERMLAEGLWSTTGKTPQATIYAAMHREIATKGADARFAKVERGKFTLAAGQQPPY